MIFEIYYVIIYIVNNYIHDYAEIFIRKGAKIKMFSVGEHVVYGTHGVCAISEVTSMSFGSEKRDYYVLSPVSDPKSTIFVPVDNETLIAQMRRVLTKEEIDALLDSVEPCALEWIANDSKRKEFCAATIKSGDRLAIINMIEMLYLHQEEMRDQKKHFHVTDERFLREAEKLLHDEFAFVLGIPNIEVYEYIGSRIKKSS